MKNLTERITRLSTEKRALLERHLMRSGDRRAGRGRGGMPPIERLERFEGAPLSYAQERLWILDQLYPGTYNMQGAVWIRGTLKVDVLERALGEIVRRHEVLRTIFETNGEHPVQRVQPAGSLTLERSDMSGLALDERKRVVNELMAGDARREFDLKRDLLIRARLVKLGNEEHALLLTLHHVAFDGWSMGLLVQEFEQLYEAFLQERKSPLEELPIQYADYAAWQRQWMQDEVLEKQLAYWREQLAGAPDELDLPKDSPIATQGGSSSAGRSSVFLPAEMARRLSGFAQQNEMTSFMMMLAGLSLILSRWSRQSDLVIGTVVAGRRNEQVEKLIGCFVNFLPVRIRIRGDHSLFEFLQEVKNVWMGALAHQDCPFEQIVNAINPRRLPGKNPLYNVGFLLHNVPFQSLSGKLFETDLVHGELQGALLDLRFVVHEAEAGISISCDYRRCFFEKRTIDLLLNSFTQALTALTQLPQTQVQTFTLPDELIGRPRAAAKTNGGQTIAIAATFVADPVADTIEFWSRELDLGIHIQFAPYNQVFQQLLDVRSELSTNSRGMNVILLRFEDWEMFGRESELNDRDRHCGDILKKVVDFAAALKAAARRSPVPYIVTICPDSEETSRNSERMALYGRAREILARELANIDGTFMVTANQVLTGYRVSNHSDSYADEVGRVPFTTEFFSALGTLMIRRLHVLQRRPCKVIVLDCDQTLWAGVCGEDGPEAVKLTKACDLLQKFMLAQLRNGRLLCLCSRNNEEDVNRTFESHPEFPLRLEHFAGRRINWRSKSENIRELSEELQLGLDSFVFVDDSPTECAEVEANCPEVVTLRLPESAEQMAQFLDHCWIFDQLKVSTEDSQRLLYYQREQERRKFRSKSASLADFLEGLQLRVEISKVAPQQIERVVQIAERVNQFNIAGRGCTRGEMMQLQQAGEMLTVTVSDRFGDYGLVGVMAYHFQETVMNVSAFLLSCRALGKGVEHRMLARLGEESLRKGIEFVAICFTPTSRNKPAKGFLESLECECQEQSGGGLQYRFSSKAAAAVEFKPSSVPEETVNQVSAAGNENAPIGKSFPYHRIALEANSAGRIARAVATRGGRKTAVPCAYIPPRNRTEEQLCGIWQELLQTGPIGIQQDFFEAGGNSIMATRLLSRIRKVFGVELSLTSVFASPKLMTLAEIIEWIVQERQTSVTMDGERERGTL